jgi:hypothetical protein
MAIRPDSVPDARVGKGLAGKARLRIGRICAFDGDRRSCRDPRAIAAPGRTIVRAGSGAQRGASRHPEDARLRNRRRSEWERPAAAGRHHHGAQAAAALQGGESAPYVGGWADRPQRCRKQTNVERWSPGSAARVGEDPGDQLGECAIEDPPLWQVAHRSQGAAAKGGTGAVPRSSGRRPDAGPNNRAP